MAIFSEKNAPLIILGFAAAFVIWWVTIGGRKEGAAGVTLEQSNQGNQDYLDLEKRRRDARRKRRELNAQHGSGGGSKFSVRESVNGEYKCPEGSTDTGRQWGEHNGHRQCKWFI